MKIKVPTVRYFERALKAQGACSDARNYLLKHKTVRGAWENTRKLVDGWHLTDWREWFEFELYQQEMISQNTRITTWEEVRPFLLPWCRAVLGGKTP